MKIKNWEFLFGGLAFLLVGVLSAPSLFGQYHYWGVLSAALLSGAGVVVLVLAFRKQDR